MRALADEKLLHPKSPSVDISSACQHPIAEPAEPLLSLHGGKAPAQSNTNPFYPPVSRLRSHENKPPSLSLSLLSTLGGFSKFSPSPKSRFVTPGLDDSFTPLTAVERFDPADGSWESLRRPQMKGDSQLIWLERVY